MKNLLFVLAMLTITFNLSAQAGINVQKVNASEVPQAVLDAQNQYFAGITVNLWEKQSASFRDKSGERYVANFQNSGQKTKARYYTNGTGGTATAYYIAKELPQAIQNAANSNYPNYKLLSGEMITTLTNNKSVFRIRLRSGAKKLVVFLDANGNEIAPNSLPDEVTIE